MIRLLAWLLPVMMMIGVAHGQTKIPAHYWLGDKSVTGNGYGLDLNDDNIFITGDTDNKPFLLKYQDDGKFLWSRAYPIHGSGRAVVSDINNVYVAGIDFDDHKPRAFVSKFWAEDGRMIWQRFMDGPGREIATHVEIGNDSAVYTGGVTTDAIDQSIEHIGSADIFVAKYDVNGRQQWIRQLGTSLEDVLDHMAVYGNDIYLFTTSRIAKNYFEKSVHKLNKDGQTLWTRRFILKSNLSVLGVGFDDEDHMFVIKPNIATKEHYSNLRIFQLKNSYDLAPIKTLPRNIRVLEGFKLNWRDQLVHSNFPFRKDTYIFVNTYRRNGKLVKHEIIDSPRKWDVVYDFNIRNRSFCVAGSSGDVTDTQAEQRQVLLACEKE